MSGSDRYPLRAELEAYTKPKYKEYNVHSEDGSLMWCKDHVDGKYENTTKGWAALRKHIKSSHLPEVDFWCSVCDFHDPSKENVKEHKDQVHVSSPLTETECNKCHKTYYHARSKKKSEDDNSLRRLRDHQATSCGARADRPLNLAYRNWDHDQRKFIYTSRPEGDPEFFYRICRAPGSGDGDGAAQIPGSQHVVQPRASASAPTQQHSQLPESQDPTLREKDAFIKAHVAQIVRGVQVIDRCGQPQSRHVSRSMQRGHARTLSHRQAFNYFGVSPAC